MKFDIDEIMYWIKTNKLVVGVIIFFITLVIVLSVFKPSDEEDAGQDIVTLSEEFKAKAEVLNTDFSIVEETVLPDSSKTHLISLHYKLYLKKKEMTLEEFEVVIKDFVELVKFKKNYNDKYVSTISIEVYDRKTLADKGIFPKAYAKYMLDELPKNAPESDKIMVETSGDSSTVLWDYSNKQDGIPVYDSYSFNTKFKHVLDKNNIPLTDSELNYLLKIFDLNIIAERDILSIESLEDLLLWDYGLYPSGGAVGNNFESYLYQIGISFSEILERFVSSYDNEPQMFVDTKSNYKESLYRNALIVGKPKLANYVINRKLALANVDAKKELVKTPLTMAQLDSVDREYIPYLDMFIEDAKEHLADAGIEATDSNVNDFIFKPKGYSEGENKEENKEDIKNK